MNGQTDESFDERIIFMSTFNDIECTKSGKTETCVHSAKGVAAFATQFKPGHWCLLDPGSENTWWCGNSNEPRRKMRHCRIADGWQTDVSHFTSRYFQRQSHIAWTVKEMRKKLPLPRHIRKQEGFSSIPCWQAIECIYTRI